MANDYDAPGWSAFNKWAVANFAAETEGNAQRAFFAGRRSLDADIAELERQIEEYKQTLTEMGVDVDD